MNSISSANQENVVENKSQLFIRLAKYLTSPIVAGFYGFALVFSVNLILKLLSFLLGINKPFQLDLIDVMISSIGFLLMFLINIRRNLHQSKHEFTSRSNNIYFILVGFASNYFQFSTASRERRLCNQTRKEK